MVPRENKNNAYAKFGGTNKEYYGIFRSGLLIRLAREIPVILKFSASDRLYMGSNEIQQQISNYKNVGSFVTIYEVINTIVSFLVFGLGFSLC